MGVYAGYQRSDYPHQLLIVKRLELNFVIDCEVSSAYGGFCWGLHWFKVKIASRY